MAVAAFTSESGAYRAAKDVQDAIEDNVAKGMAHNEAELKGIEEYAIEASILKVWISDAAQDSSDRSSRFYLNKIKEKQ